MPPASCVRRPRGAGTSQARDQHGRAEVQRRDPGENLFTVLSLGRHSGTDLPLSTWPDLKQVVVRVASKTENSKLIRVIHQTAATMKGPNA